MFDYATTELLDIEQRLNPVLARAKAGSTETQQLALDATRLLSCTEDRLEQYSNQGFFRRCWSVLSGKTGELRRANERDLIEMQKASWRYLGLLQERDLMLAHSIITVKNNLLTLAVREEETRREIERMANRVYDRFVQLEDRMKNVEVASSIHGWLLTLETHDYDERFSPLFRLLCVVRDFDGIKDEDWNTQELRYLQKGVKEVGLPWKDSLSLGQFVDGLVEEIEVGGFQTYEQLLFRPNCTGRVPSAFVLDNISVPSYVSLFELSDSYLKGSGTIELLADKLSLSKREAISQVIRGFIQRQGINMEIKLPLRDLAVELLHCMRLSRVLYQESQNTPEQAVEQRETILPPAEETIAPAPETQGANAKMEGTPPSDRPLEVDTHTHPPLPVTDGGLPFNSRNISEDNNPRKASVIDAPLSCRRSRESVLDVLRDFQRSGGGKRSGFYVVPNIPAQKLANARVSCSLANEEVLALIDATLFGSAKNGMLITAKGVHFHNDWSAHTSGTFTLRYEDMSVDQIRLLSESEIVLAEGASFNCTASDIKSPAVADLMYALLNDAADEGEEEPSSVKNARNAGASQSAKEGTRRPPQREEILAFVRDFARTGTGGKRDGLYVFPNIPDRKISNARASCGIVNQEILALIDGTVFGSAKNALVITQKTVFVHNDWGSLASGTHSVPMAELLEDDVNIPSKNEVVISPGVSFNTSGCSMNPADIAVLIIGLCALVQRS